MVVVAGPALAQRGGCDDLCKAKREEWSRDYSDWRADERARETNRALRGIENEMSGLRDELRRRPVDDDWLPSRDFPARRRY